MKRLVIAVAALACGLAAAPAASAAPYVVTLDDSVGDVDAAVDDLQRELGLPRATHRYASACMPMALISVSGSTHATPGVRASLAAWPGPRSTAKPFSALA